ncbi:MAG: rod shape-determining protein RodA [Rikenellaceae bacterium]
MIHSNISGQRTSERLFEGIDPVAILLYVAIVVVGCVCITSASFDVESTDFFDSSHFYVKQYMWAGIAVVAAVVVLLTESSLYHKYSFVLYVLGVLSLICALLFGREVNGAKSWFEVGGFRLQPVELVKISTSLILARVMSELNFSITDLRSLSRVAGVVLLPLAVIMLQNDTGSGIVFGSYLFVLYREGLDRWLCLPLLLIAALFILSFLLSPLVLLLMSLTMCVVSNAMMYGMWSLHLRYVAIVMLSAILLSVGWWMLSGEFLSYYISLLITTLVSLPIIIMYAFRKAFARTFVLAGFYLSSMVFLPTSDYIFNYILRDHQRNRIMSFLGIVDDPLGIDYNVNQSKIAIGSGGMWGKGFLNGTQIRFGFVPERHTDFIFCDLAEEWGFVGAFVLLALIMALILKLMQMGERQVEAFGRIYCYCVASILLFHTLVNVGMTIGLMPVMGIPLPMVSYGGSSLVAFTIMIFIAFRLDASASSLKSY